MSMDQRIESLQKRHAHIEDLIRKEENRPAPDSGKIHELKREKLSLKDEIERIRSSQKQAA